MASHGLHNNKVKFPNDVLLYCSVHQHRRRDVRFKPPIAWQPCPVSNCGFFLSICGAMCLLSFPLANTNILQKNCLFYTHKRYLGSVKLPQVRINALYTLFQNGRHLDILLFLLKLDLDALFKAKYSFEFSAQEQGIKG